MKGNIVTYTYEDLVNYLKSYTGDKSNIKIIIKPFDTLELYNKYKDILI